MGNKVWAISIGQLTTNLKCSASLRAIHSSLIPMPLGNGTVCSTDRQARNHSFMCWHVWHSFQPDVVKMLTTAAPKYTVYRCCKTMSVVVVDGNLNPYRNTLHSITTWIIWPQFLRNIWAVIVGCCLATNSLNSNSTTELDCVVVVNY